MAHIPYRTGLKSIAITLRLICKWIVKYRALWLTFMTDPQIAKFDELMALCEEVSALITEILATDIS